MSRKNQSIASFVLAILMFIGFIFVFNFAGIRDNFLTATLFNTRADIADTSIEALTLASIKLGNNLKAAPENERVDLSRKLRELSSSRKKVLNDLIESDPEKALRMVIPQKIKQTLALEAQENIEEEVNVEGELENVIADDFENNVFKNYYYLSTSQGKLQIYLVGNKLESLFTGTTLRIQGYKLNNKLLTEEDRIEIVSMKSNF